VTFIPGLYRGVIGTCFKGMILNTVAVGAVRLDNVASIALKKKDCFRGFTNNSLFLYIGPSLTRLCIEKGNNRSLPKAH